MSASRDGGPRKLTRDRSRALVAGVCAGFAARLDVDPVIVRVVFGLLVVVTGGAALAAYVILWLFMDEGAAEPAPDDVNPVEAAIRRIQVSNWRVAAGVGFLTLALLLLLREVGIWWSDALAWPLILAASGAALLWRQSNLNVPPASSASRPGAARLDEGRRDEAPVEEPRRVRDRRPLPRRLRGRARGRRRAALPVRERRAGPARDVVLAIVVAALALGLILAPFLWRLGRNLAAERAERIRSQERAEVAAHLHDSVLQTLALMQKRADDPREVAALARRQERELRGWLAGGPRRAATATASRRRSSAAAAEVEDAHGVAIEVVAVGDCAARRARARRWSRAAREALTNAAKFAGDAGPIAVYAEVEAGRDRRSSSATAAPASTPTRCPPTAAACASRSSAGWSATAGRATIRSAPGRGHRGRARRSARRTPMSDRRASSSSTTTRCSAPASAPSSRGSSRCVGEAGRSRRRCAVIAEPSPTSSCSTSTCRAAAGSR